MLCACGCSDAFEMCAKTQLVDGEPGTILARCGMPDFSGVGKALCVFHWNGKVWKAVRKTYLLKNNLDAWRLCLQDKSRGLWVLIVGLFLFHMSSFCRVLAEYCFPGR